mgnify:CR=1 FL=1
MIPEKIKQFAFKREIQVLAVFTAVVGVSYYLYLKNKQKTTEKK